MAGVNPDLTQPRIRYLMAKHDPPIHRTALD